MGPPAVDASARTPSSRSECIARLTRPETCEVYFGLSSLFMRWLELWIEKDLMMMMMMIMMMMMMIDDDDRTDAELMIHTRSIGLHRSNGAAMSSKFGRPLSTVTSRSVNDSPVSFAESGGVTSERSPLIASPPQDGLTTFRSPEQVGTSHVFHWLCLCVMV